MHFVGPINQVNNNVNATYVAPRIIFSDTKIRADLLLIYICRIINPLAGLDAQSLMTRVNQFVAITNWPRRDLELLKLGAILAQTPGAFGNMPEDPAYGRLRPLDEDEISRLQREHQDGQQWESFALSRQARNTGK